MLYAYAPAHVIGRPRIQGLEGDSLPEKRLQTERASRRQRQAAGERIRQSARKRQTRIRRTARRRRLRKTLLRQQEGCRRTRVSAGQIEGGERVVEDAKAGPYNRVRFHLVGHAQPRQQI